MKTSLPDFRDLAGAVKGKLIAGEGYAGRRPTGISTDTRTLKKGELFVALKGECFDGHTCLGQAAERGASGAVVSRMDEGASRLMAGSGMVVIKVRNTLQALLDLALRLRQDYPATVIAVTGSFGKTLTKDFLAAILEPGHRVVQSTKSFNNEVGVPLTIFRMNGSTEFAVVEMGSRGAGHIRALTRCALPDIGVITNVGPAHISSFKSLDGVARAKGELLEALPASGTAVLNADDPYFE